MFRIRKIVPAPVLVVALVACAGVSNFRKPSPAGTMAPAATMTTPRSGHTSTLLPNGEVLITGGMNGNGTYFDTTEIYSPARNSFRPGPKMGAKRVGHTATLLPDGKVLIAGGYGGSNLSDAEIYDPATERFTPAGPMTGPRAEQIAVLLKDGRVLLAGGLGQGETFLASAEIYDPATNAFTRTGSMAGARESHTATLLANGKVLITGGHKDYREAMKVYSSAELYDPATGTFSPAGDMTIARHKHAAALLANGDVLIAGGSDKRDWRGKYTSAEIYDTTKGTFHAIGEMAEARFKLNGTLVALKNGRVLVAGGGRVPEVYDPVANRFTPANGQIDSARFFSSATALRDGSVLIVGGYNDHMDTSRQSWIYRP